MQGGVSATIELDDAPIRALFGRLLAFPAQLRSAADEIGEAMVASTQRRFAAETGPDGLKWKPSQRVVKHGGKTLQLTRRLYRSLVHNVIAAAASGASVEWGTNVAYAWVHQVGALLYHRAGTVKINRRVKDGEIQPGFVKRGKSNFETEHTFGNYAVIIPARPFVGIDAGDTAEISEILGDALARAFAGNVAGRIA